MVRILLDTCVVSEIRRPDANPTVLAHAIRLVPGETFVSVITLGELIKGIELLPSGGRKRELSNWYSGFEKQYAETVLDIDTSIARIWGSLEAKAKSSGFTLATTDGLIAATAIHHELQVMTRNVRDFDPTGAMTINPWDE